MKDKLTRRRLLADTLCLGGALLGASLLTRPEPFFNHFLEGQDPPAGTISPHVADLTHSDQPAPVTKAPSDGDRNRPRYECSAAHPSDSDTHEPRYLPRELKRQQSLLPFWGCLS